MSADIPRNVRVESMQADNSTLFEPGRAVMFGTHTGLQTGGISLISFRQMLYFRRGNKFSMLDKLIEGGWIRCPDCGSEDVGLVPFDDLQNKWVSRFRCANCGESVSERVTR